MMRDAGVGLAAAAAFLVAWLAGGSLWVQVNSGDLHGMFLPWYEYVSRALWQEGRIPLWQPWQFGGTPVLGLGQTGSLYPPVLVLFAVLSPWAALQTLYTLHVAILGTGIATLLRLHGLGRMVAFVATLIAVAALFRGPLEAGVDHPSFLAAMAWSPWVLVCWQRAMTGATLRWTAGVAVASALQWVAGYPDFPLDFAVLLGVIALVADAGTLPRRVAVAVGGLALGAALAAVQLLPTLEVAAESIRTEELQLKETLRMLFSVFAPSQLAYAVGKTWGLAATAFALIAVGYGIARRDRRRLAWTAAFVWSVFALNRPFAWLYLLPPWDGVRFPFGWSGGVALFLALLAAAGIAATTSARRGWLRVGGVLLAIVATGDALVAIRRAPATLPAFSPGNAGYRVPEVPEPAERARLLAEAAGEGRALSERDGRAGNALRYGVRIIQGHEPSVLPRRMVHLFTPGGLYDNLGIFRNRDWQQLSERPGLAALLGITVVGIDPRRAGPLEHVGFTRIGTLPGGDVLLRAPVSWPRARLVHRSEVAPGGDGGSLAAVLAHPWGRPEVVVLDEGSTHPPLGEVPGDRTESVRIVADEAERVVIEASVAAPALLVLGDPAYPGWHADVDGTPVPILIADHAFRAVFVPAGRHTITFAYAPRAVRLGLGVTAAAALVLVALIVIPPRRRA